ncbi:MAG: hypothetical protein KAS32_29910 [Candidatus Peribacteraceae bacterium]|nr:hypothetical protein [Candidatus Peribacteraceae bacterium]
MLEKQHRLIDDLMVYGKFAAKTAAYAMTIRDRIISCNATAAAFAVTLPNVSEAEGKSFIIVATVADSTRKITFVNNGAADWSDLGTLELTAPGQRIIFFSDGMRYHVIVDTSSSESRKLIDRFSGDVLIVQNDGTAASGADTEVNVFSSGDLSWNLTNIGTQTVIAPVFSADGLDIGRDQTDNEGTIVDLGITAKSPAAYVIGTDAFYAKLQFAIETVAGSDDCAFGFKIASARQAAIDDETDMAVLNVIAGAIKVETALNNATAVTTDTTDAWADGETHELAVYISAAGIVSYTIDGVAPTVAPTLAVTFDTGDVFVPFIYLIQANADQTDGVDLKYFECGLQ